MEETETSRIIQFLMSLNENFGNIRGQILNMKPRPSLTEIYNMLDQYESQRVIGSSPILVSAHTAFQVHHEAFLLIILLCWCLKAIITRLNVLIARELDIRWTNVTKSMVFLLALLGERSFHLLELLT